MLTSQKCRHGHLLQSSEEAYRLNKSKDLYLAYIGYISNSFYPYTLSRAKRTNNNKADFVVKNFNKLYSIMWQFLVKHTFLIAVILGKIAKLAQMCKYRKVSLQVLAILVIMLH